MATRTVHDCDRCGAENIRPITLRIPTGTYRDPCEGTKPDDEQVDLCERCAARAFGRVAQRLDEAAGKALVAEIRDRRAKGAFKPL